MREKRDKKLIKTLIKAIYLYQSDSIILDKRGHLIKINSSIKYIFKFCFIFSV